MAYNVDLHTHSLASPDGSLSLAAYRTMFATNRLHCIAVTDHNTIDMAKELQDALGADKIIVGEEITTAEGEITGLYLTETIQTMLSAAETVQRIKEQGGLVYIPHPFETVRKGITARALEQIASDVDIIEAHNGRAVFQNRSVLARQWAAQHRVVMAASSDAHGASGWGRSYSILNEMPTRETLVVLLQNARYRQGYVGMRGILYPKVNRLRKRGKHA